MAEIQYSDTCLFHRVQRDGGEVETPSRSSYRNLDGHRRSLGRLNGHFSHDGSGARHAGTSCRSRHEYIERAFHYCATGYVLAVEQGGYMPCRNPRMDSDEF